MAILYFFRTSQITKINNNILYLEDILNEIQFYCPDNDNNKLMCVLNEHITQNKEENYNILCEAVDNLSRLLFKQLNEIHEVSESQRYWETIYITCLHRIVGTIKERLDLLTYIIKHYSIKEVFIPKVYINHLVTEDSNDYIQKSRNSIHWNIYLFAKLIEFVPNISINYLDEYHQRELEYNKFTFNNKPSIFRSLVNLFYRLVYKLVFRNHHFFYQTYVNLKDRLLLSLKLRELLFCFNSFPKKNICINVNIDVRTSMFKTNISALRGLDFVAIHLLPLVLPKVFLEYYKSYLKIAKNQLWPLNPKVIFTSNAYDTNEIFKIWAAEKVKQGAKYVIGQHGYGIGVNKFPLSERYYKRIAHNFITFGLLKDRFTIPTYNFLKKSIRGSFTPSNIGDILIITGLAKLDKFSFLSGSNFSRLNVLKSINDFESIGIKNVILKLHPLDSISNWNILFNKSGRTPRFLIPSLLNSIFPPKISLVVFTYESTLMLRNISENIPFILVLENFDHIIEDYKVFYQDLVEVDVIVENMDNLKEVLKRIHHNVYDWWNDAKRQAALDNFRKNLCCSKKSARTSLYEALIS